MRHAPWPSRVCSHAVSENVETRRRRQQLVWMCLGDTNLILSKTYTSPSRTSPARSHCSYACFAPKSPRGRLVCLDCYSCYPVTTLQAAKMSAHSHALRALDQAVRGDPAGLSFIEQTATIYVLDAASTPGALQVYGWWNFLNEALTDIERHEAEGRTVSFAHVRLLSTVTRRVARRRPVVDRQLVGACIENASTTSMNLLANKEVTQALLASNDGLRKQTLGRIAAIVFDVGPSVASSSLGDPIALEQFAGVIAANAVCTGPASVGHLVSEWMLQSAGSLPRLSVSAIMYHVAMESTSKGRPNGIRDATRALAPPVLRVLGRIYVETLEESGEGRVVALSLRAIECWCRLNEVGTVRIGQIFAPTGVSLLTSSSTRHRLSESIRSL